MISCGDMEAKLSKYIDIEFEAGNFPARGSFKGSHFKNILSHNTNFGGASLYNLSAYSIDPQINNVRKRKFTVPDVLNLLSGFDIIITDSV